MTPNDTFDTIKRETEVMLKAVATEAERLARIGSLKLKLSTLQGEIRDYQGEIGAWVSEHRDLLPDDAEVEALLGKIDSLRQEMEQQQRKLDALAQRVRTQSADDAEHDDDSPV